MSMCYISCDDVYRRTTENCKNPSQYKQQEYNFNNFKENRNCNSVSSLKPLISSQPLIASQTRNFDVQTSEFSSRCATRQPNLFPENCSTLSEKQLIGLNVKSPLYLLDSDLETVDSCLSYQNDSIYSSSDIDYYIAQCILSLNNETTNSQTQKYFKININGQDSYTSSTKQVLEMTNEDESNSYDLQPAASFSDSLQKTDSNPTLVSSESINNGFKDFYQHSLHIDMDYPSYIDQNIENINQNISLETCENSQTDFLNFFHCYEKIDYEELAEKTAISFKNANEEFKKGILHFYPNTNMDCEYGIKEQTFMESSAAQNFHNILFTESAHQICADPKTLQLYNKSSREIMQDKKDISINPSSYYNFIPKLHYPERSTYDKQNSLDISELRENNDQVICKSVNELSHLDKNIYRCDNSTVPLYRERYHNRVKTQFQKDLSMDKPVCEEFAPVGDLKGFVFDRLFERGLSQDDLLCLSEICQSYFVDSFITSADYKIPKNFEIPSNFPTFDIAYENSESFTNGNHFMYEYTNSETIPGISFVANNLCENVMQCYRDNCPY